MPESVQTESDTARPRLRSLISSVLLIMIALMIVRDILVRRWGSATPAATDITQHSP